MKIINKSTMHNMNLMSYFFLIFLVIEFIGADNSPRTYPKELHERFEKLYRRKGRDKIGTWGSWSHWSPCSRSCGTGVAIQSRECLLSKSKRERTRIAEEGKTTSANRCVGRYKRFQLCNTQMCPQGLVDFRREQCASYNHKAFKGRYYSWEPYIDKSDSCALNCQPMGLGFFATLQHSVVDGTPCDPFHPGVQNRICVGGRCMKIGCDGLLGSGREVDSCGVCGGNGTSCRLIQGVFRKPTMPFGFNFLAVIPPKAENISFYHTKPSSNYIAIREQDGNYLLNGPAGMNSSGTFLASGTVFSYARPHANGGDHLYSKGPTTNSIDIMLFYQTPDPGVFYEYRIPTIPGHSKKSNPRPLHLPQNSPNIVIPHRPTHRKQPTYPISPLSPPPGIVNDAISSNSRSNFINNINRNNNYVGRDREISAKDRQHRYNKKIESHKKKYEKQKNDYKKHSGHNKGHKNKSRRRKRYKWISNGFTPCSLTCGGGTQTTRTVCVKRKRKDIEVPSQFCAGLPQPEEDVVRCNLRPCPAQWDGKSWSDCSVTCGIGIQTRSIVCSQRVSTELTIHVSEDSCKNPNKPITAQVCQMRECNGPPRWNVQPWSKCSSQCGLGTRKRDVICENNDGKVEEKLCKDSKPMEEEMCDMGSCASDTWFFSPWEQTCQGPCGEGSQRRRLYCSGDATIEEEVTQPESSCNKDAKPEATRSCENKKDCLGSWFTGPWSECDVECGAGRLRRAVVCVTWTRGRYKVAKGNLPCKEAGEKPSDTMACAVECKAEWFTSQWSQCSVSCDTGVQRREVKCLHQQKRPSLECPTAQKPDSRQKCNQQKCPTVELNDDSGIIQSDSAAAFTEDSKIDSKSSTESYSSNLIKGSCMDRMKNCHLVFKARLCRLKYYTKLCCTTCQNS